MQELDRQGVGYVSLTKTLNQITPAVRWPRNWHSSLPYSARSLVDACELYPFKLGGMESASATRNCSTAHQSHPQTTPIPAAEIAARFGIARSTLYRTVCKPAV
jgi:hypothetical protein